jgi:hypothetical protein
MGDEDAAKTEQVHKEEKIIWKAVLYLRKRKKGTFRFVIADLTLAASTSKPCAALNSAVLNLAVFDLTVPAYGSLVHLRSRWL